jgi:hypothetical protein
VPEPKLPAQPTAPEPVPSPATSRWELIRDIVIFQLKLAIDELRDVVLVPISLVAGITDLVSGRERPRSSFYEVVRLGRRSERWINLFGASEELEEDDLPSLDSLVGQVERLVVEQAEQGGATASAKEAIDRSLDRIGELRRLGRRPEDEPQGPADDG